ncbi:adenine nucleotide alpha hydrolase [Novilysobacter selenitireducens]|uniref:Adenine nucleotide alpha hydrolase n=1 Tax=Novilysobacter selenitireducens TaxID=2872639 RepID=A0ABS7T883_9GAMM|nr:adenine nucleotide alpha hydrolase [Lysobacter selenitireducens]MBZ4040078.1 adenine nucleotide alpha hydrolase [Lysobacter selenitireducens]
MTDILLSWSGGKDAAWTLHTLRQRGDVRVVGLLTTLTEGFDRVSMQGIRRDVLHAQADAAGLPVIEAWIPQRADNAVYETSFADALRRAQARWPGLSTLAFGDLFLADIRAWREALCARLGWSPLFPLFGSDTGALANAMIAGGLRATLCCVDTQQLDAAFSGRDFDASLLDALPASCDPCGENGEFHTLVHAGPMFTAPLPVARGETVLRDGRFAYTDFVLQPDSTGSNGIL